MAINKKYNNQSIYHKRKEGKIVYFQDPETGILHLSGEFFSGSEIDEYKSRIDNQNQMFPLSCLNSLVTLKDVKDVKPLVLNPRLEQKIIETEEKFGRVDYTHVIGAGSDGT
ncbi:MAG: hypothetical protein AABW51_04730 [Nanoarchaeota archaeon]